MHQPERNIGSTLSSGYRYSFNGMEKDDEMKGNGNSYTTEFRQYDSRIGWWLSIDPKATEFESPYSSMANNPLLFSDVKGDSVITSNLEDAQKTVDDLYELYLREYGVDNPFSVQETKFKPVVDYTLFRDPIYAEEYQTGYAIVTNNTAGDDPNFWNDDITGDMRGYRAAIWNVLNSEDAITLEYSDDFEIREYKGTVKYDGKIVLYSGLSSTWKGDNTGDGPKTWDRDFTIAAIFLHEAIWHKSWLGSISWKQCLESANAMFNYYHSRESDTPKELNEGGNKIEPNLSRSSHQNYLNYVRWQIAIRRSLGGGLKKGGAQ